MSDTDGIGRWGRSLPPRLPVEPEPPRDVDTTRLVLDALRLGSFRSRPDLARVTGLSRGLLGQRLEELERHGLIEESGSGPSTGGRPPRSLRFRPEAGYILAADLGATSIDVAAADLSAGILRHHAEPADIGAGPEVILGRVEELFATIQRELPPSCGQL
jgi:hypothetical protein